MDFEQKIKDLVVKGKAQKEVVYSTLFTDNWHIYADKLIDIYKSSNKKDIKKYYAQNEELFDNC